MGRYFKSGLIFSSLTLVLLLLMFFTALPVSATTATPPDNYVAVPPGEVFLLRGTVTFDKAATGYFMWGPVYWYHNGDPAENFTLENTPSVYWEDGTPVENVSISDFTVGNVGWQIVIDDNGDGIERNGTFYVDIWLRAASGGGIPHKVDNQWIYFSMDEIILYEPGPVTVSAPPIYVDVVPWDGTVSFELENLYKVSLEKDLYLENGTKLVVKFYKYDKITLQDESVIDNFTPPENVKENENVLHPRGAEGFPNGTVQIAKLVLTENNTDEVISEIASLTVHQSHLRDRYIDIIIDWGGHPELHDAFRDEIIDILIQWSSAPP
jgi:hypothetical protein